jgi:hypothetical protein
VTLRFPVLAGLKLPEDEIVEIRCKQQDRTVAEKKDIDFDGEYVYPFIKKKKKKIQSKQIVFLFLKKMWRYSFLCVNYDTFLDVLFFLFNWKFFSLLFPSHLFGKESSIKIFDSLD